jgi:hypothetical protein
VARELADGLLTVNGETEFAKHFTWTALGVQGTVLEEGEALDSPRVRAAAGPGNAPAYHAAYELGGSWRTSPDASQTSSHTGVSGCGRWLGDWSPVSREVHAGF